MVSWSKIIIVKEGRKGGREEGREEGRRLFGKSDESVEVYGVIYKQRKKKSESVAVISVCMYLSIVSRAMLHI